MINLFGWWGSILLAFCAVPQVMETIKRGNTKGISTSFLYIWLSGEIFTLLYVISSLDFPLILNYSINILFLLIILKYRYWPRREDG